jgi:hypothetical protein
MMRLAISDSAPRSDGTEGNSFASIHASTVWLRSYEPFHFLYSYVL